MHDEHCRFRRDHHDLLWRSNGTGAGSSNLPLNRGPLNQLETRKNGYSPSAGARRENADAAGALEEAAFGSMLMIFRRDLACFPGPSTRRVSNRGNQCDSRRDGTSHPLVGPHQDWRLWRPARQVRADAATSA